MCYSKIEKVKGKKVKKNDKNNLESGEKKMKKRKKELKELFSSLNNREKYWILFEKSAKIISESFCVISSKKNEKRITFFVFVFCITFI